MSRKFEEIIGVLNYNELMRLKNDLDGGAIKLKKLLELLNTEWHKNFKNKKLCMIIISQFT